MAAVNLPPGCLIAAHAGDAWQQATAQVGESLCLPPLVAPDKPGSPLLQLELLLPSAGLDAGWNVESQPPLQLVLQVADQGNAVPVDLLNKDSVGLKIEEGLGVAYSNEHGLACWFNDIRQDLVRLRPVDPWSYIETRASQARIQRMSHGATRIDDTEVLPPTGPESGSLALPARLRDSADDMRKRARTALEMMAVSKIMQQRLPSPTLNMQRRISASPSNGPLVDSRNVPSVTCAAGSQSPGLRVDDACRKEGCTKNYRDPPALLGSTTVGSESCSSLPASPSASVQLGVLCHGIRRNPSKNDNKGNDHSTPVSIAKEEPPIPMPTTALAAAPVPLHQASNFWNMLAGSAEELGPRASCASRDQERDEVRLAFQELFRGSNIAAAAASTSAASAECSGRSRSSPSKSTAVLEEEVHKSTLRPKQFEHIVQPRPAPAMPSTPGSAQRRQRCGGGSSSSCSATKLPPPVIPQNEQQQQKCRKNAAGPVISPMLQSSRGGLSVDNSGGCSRAQSLPDLQQPPAIRSKTDACTQPPGSNTPVPERPASRERTAATISTEPACRRTASAPQALVPRLRLDKLQDAEHRRRLQRLQAQARHMGHEEAVDQLDRTASDAAAKGNFVREQLEKLLVLS